MKQLCYCDVTRLINDEIYIYILSSDVLRFSMIFDNEVMASEMTFYKMFPKILRQNVIKLVYDIFSGFADDTCFESSQKMCQKSDGLLV